MFLPQVRALKRFWIVLKSYLGGGSDWLTVKSQVEQLLKDFAENSSEVSQELQDILSDLNPIMDKVSNLDAYITEFYMDLTWGYIYFSNGFLLQYGTRMNMAADAKLRINLWEPFGDDKYIVLETTQLAKAYSGEWHSSACVTSVAGEKTETFFTLIQDSELDAGGFWVAFGRGRKNIP